MDYKKLEQQLTADLRLPRRPVAVAVSSTVPAGVQKFSGTVPSGCSFWRLAAEGRTFYTVPSDHYNCPIGSYTHNIPLPPDREKDLTDTLGLMTEIGYVKMTEVPGIPRLPATPAAVVYAPLGDTPVDPDVVIMSGAANQLMLLQEVAIRSGVAGQLTTLGRPTCMAIPAALAMGTVASTGCIGNRVYTGIDAGDMYLMVPAKDLARLAQEASTIASANAKLLEYHQERRQRLTAV